jgi:hypothetical protein
MRVRLLIPVLLAAALLAATFAAAGTARAQSSPPGGESPYLDWTPVAPGIDYREYFLPGPVKVYVARMARSNLDLTIEAMLGTGYLTPFGLERIQNMAARYDQTINYWGDSGKPGGQPYWGTRSRVVVAINGSFIDLNTGLPDRGVIQSGWHARQFSEYESYSGFGWRLDRTPFLGLCVEYRANRNYVTLQQGDPDSQIKFQGINRARGDEELIIYTPQFGASTETDDDGVEVLVEMTRPTLILPGPAQALGIVREIRSGQGDTPIPFDHIVLSGSGLQGDKLLNYTQVGAQIGVTQEITHYDRGCGPDNDLPTWTKTYTSIGGSWPFLIDSQTWEITDPGATNRAPRTAIAYNDTYIYFVVVDGRSSVSIGMTIVELTGFVQNQLQATYAVNQDGGGSSAMVVNGRLMNLPSDPCPYNVYLPLARGGGSAPVRAEQADETNLGGCQRAVINGLAMVVVEPFTATTTFTPTQVVITTQAAAVRQGPGDNFLSIGTISSGSVGEVAAHAGGLNGVLATGEYWWKVAFMGVTGWTPESALEPYLPPEVYRKMD